MSVDERSSPWWRCRPLILAVLLAALIPLLWPGLPPLTDLPGHVARWHIAMAPAASPLRGYYHIRWALIGNLGADLLALLLTPLIGLLPAAKLIVIATSLAAMAGLLWLAREAHGRIPPTIFFALPFLFGWPFQMGFVNFALAQAMAFAGCALGLRLARTGRTRLRAALFVPIGLLTWIAHSAGWGMLGLIVFGAEAARRRADGQSRRATFRGAVLACLPLATPLIVMLLLHAHSARATETGDWFNMPAKFLWLISSLRDRWEWFDVASLLPPLMLLYVALRDPRLGFAPVLAWPAAFCLAAFLLLPRLLLGGSYVDMRLMPAVWILALLAVRPPPPGRFAGMLAIAGLLFFAARTTAMAASFAIRSGEQRAELGALAAIPRGSAVLALVYRPCLTPWSTIRAEHLPAYAIIERDAFVNEQWAIPGQQYLTIRYRDALPFVADPSQLVHPVGCEEFGHDLPHALVSFPRAAFSHVWLIGYRLPRPRLAGLVSVWTNGQSELYAVAGKAGTGGDDDNGSSGARASE